MDTKANCREGLLLAWADWQGRGKHLEMGRWKSANIHVSQLIYDLCVLSNDSSRLSQLIIEITVFSWYAEKVYRTAVALDLRKRTVGSVVRWAIHSDITYISNALCITVMFVEPPFQEMESWPAWQLEPWSWGRGGLCRADPWSQLERFLLHWPDWFCLWKGCWE